MNALKYVQYNNAILLIPIFWLPCSTKIITDMWNNLWDMPHTLFYKLTHLISSSFVKTAYCFFSILSELYSFLWVISDQGTCPTHMFYNAVQKKRSGGVVSQMSRFGYIVIKPYIYRPICIRWVTVNSHHLTLLLTISWYLF